VKVLDAGSAGGPGAVFMATLPGTTAPNETKANETKANERDNDV
jgi:two-component system CitB family sensor kinase